MAFHGSWGSASYRRIVVLSVTWEDAVGVEAEFGDAEGFVEGLVAEADASVARGLCYLVVGEVVELYLCDAAV